MWRESACWSGRKNSKDTGNAAEISEGRGHLVAPLSACQKTYVEMNPLKFWRGSSRARGGGSPPRVGSNALNALHGKAFSERSEDFSAARRRESIGIYQASKKSKDFFDAW